MTAHTAWYLTDASPSSPGPSTANNYTSARPLTGTDRVVLALGAAYYSFWPAVGIALVTWILIALLIAALTLFGVSIAVDPLLVPIQLVSLAVGVVALIGLSVEKSKQFLAQEDWG